MFKLMGKKIITIKLNFFPHGSYQIYTVVTSERSHKPAHWLTESQELLLLLLIKYGSK